VAKIDDLLAANGTFANSFSLKGMRKEPKAKLAVLACMDVRVPVKRMLGLADGDAHILRNAGAVVTDDVIRSLILSEYLGGIETVVIVSHTKCGLAGLGDEVMFTQVRRDHQSEAVSPASFLGFRDTFEHTRLQVAKVKAHPWMQNIDVYGLVYDVDTGKLNKA